jgi:hypothetical protein
VRDFEDPTLKLRIAIALLAGFAATGLAWILCRNAGESRAALGSGIAIGGLLGTTVSVVFCGAQVAFVRHKPRSNASLAAFAGGFFTKLVLLVVGILLLHPMEETASPVGFGVAFLAASLLAGAIVYSALGRA